MRRFSWLILGVWAIAALLLSASATPKADRSFDRDESPSKIDQSPDRLTVRERLVEAWLTEVLDHDLDRAMAEYESLDRSAGQTPEALVAQARGFEISAIRGDSDRTEALRRRLRLRGLPIGPRTLAVSQRTETATRPVTPQAILRAGETP